MLGKIVQLIASLAIGIFSIWQVSSASKKQGRSEAQLESAISTQEVVSDVSSRMQEARSSVIAIKKLSRKFQLLLR